MSPTGGKQGPMAFLSENRATTIAMAIVNNNNVAVEIDHQIMNENGEWISTPDE